MNLETIKNIIRNVVEDEKKIHSLNADVNPITTLQFYKHYTNKMLKEMKATKPLDRYIFTCYH